MTRNKTGTGVLLTAMAMWSVQAAAALVVDFGGDTDDRLRWLRLNADGTIFAEVQLPAPEQDWCGILSLDANGAANTAFDQDGRLSLSGCARDLQFEPDGSLAFLENFPPSSAMSLRLRTASGAVLTTSPVLYPNSLSFPTFVIPQMDGTYLLGGNARCCYAGTAREWFVGRVNFDGTSDPTFTNGGRISFAVGENSNARSMHQLPNGKILLTGTAGYLVIPDLVIMRLNADGSSECG